MLLGDESRCVDAVSVGSGLRALAHCSSHPVPSCIRPVLTDHQMSELFLPYLCVSDGCLVHRLELPGTLFILPEVSLAANKDDRRVPTEVLHLRVPLGIQNKTLRIGGLLCRLFLTSDFVPQDSEKRTTQKHNPESYLHAHGVNVHMQAPSHELIISTGMQTTDEQS